MIAQEVNLVEDQWHSILSCMVGSRLQIFSEYYYKYCLVNHSCKLGTGLDQMLFPEEHLR